MQNLIFTTIKHFQATVIMLSFRTDKPVLLENQIRLFLEEQADQGLQ